MNENVNKILGVTLVAQIALAVGVSFAKDESAMAPPSKVLPELSSEAVSKIEITGDASPGGAGMTSPKSVTLTKSGASWGVAGADGYPVDTSKITTLLDSLGKLKAGAPVANKAAHFKKLEVADDKYQRKLVLTQDGKETTLLLGSSPGFKRVHVRKLGEDEVRLAEGISIWDVGFKAADWVDRAYSKVPEADVWGLTLENAKGKIQLEKAPATGEWALMGATQPLKKSAIDELVRKVATVSLEEPIGKGEKPEQSLDRPQATITLITGTSTIAGTPPPSTTTRVLRVGSKAGEANAYYVKSTSSEYVVTAPGYGVDALLSKAAADLYDTPAAAAKPSPAPKH